MSDLIKKEEEMLATQNEAPLGFEDDSNEDMIIPRVKVVNMLSPEFKEKAADEGDVINSLTKDKLNGKVFVPVFKYSSNINWIPRSEGGGIRCHASDGKIGVPSDLNQPQLRCIECRKNEFDNTKQGSAAFPSCTKYINFFGFIEGEPMPIILSFAKTNYNEGKKLYSLAKVTMQNMWNHGYILSSKKMAKNGNEWFNIEVKPNGPTNDEARALGRNLFDNFRKANLNVDIEDSSSEAKTEVDTTKTEF